MNLEKACIACNGTRKVKGKDALTLEIIDKWCFRCRGKGTEPTDEGREILRLVAKYGDQKLLGIGEDGCVSEEEW